MIGPPVPGFDDGHPAQDQRAHDAFAKFGFRDQQRAQSLGRNDKRFHRLLSDRVHQRRPSRQLRQLAHEIAGAVDQDWLGIGKIAVLGDSDRAGKEDHEAGSDLSACHQCFTGGERACFAEPAHPFDL